MNKARDLLPWIMGGLMIAAVAAVIAVGSTHTGARANLPVGAMDVPLHPASVPTPGPTPAPAPAGGPESTPPTVPAPTLVPASIQAPAQPVSTSGQIWECTINGVKTFSGKPCGEKPLLREISAVNGMVPTPAASYRSEPESRYPPDYSYPTDQETSNPPVQEVVHAYPVFIGRPLRERRRPDHPHRPVHDPYRTPPPPKH